MSQNDDEIKRLLKYLKYLDFLHKEEPTVVRSILTMINRYVIEPQGKKRLVRHQDLAEKMLDFGVYQKVIEFANELIQNPVAREQFRDLTQEGTGEPREALVRDYMQSIPKGSLSSSKSTLHDLVNFFKTASPEIRYYIIVDDNGSLHGIVSVNDFTRHLQEIKDADKTTSVVNLPFYNSTPKVIVDTDKMEYAASLFYEAQQAGKKITKLLAVDEHKKPVGFLAEPDIVRWESINL